MNNNLKKNSRTGLWMHMRKKGLKGSLRGVRKNIQLGFKNISWNQFPVQDGVDSRNF